MVAKLAILVLTLALFGSAVLVVRQQRLLVYAEMTATMRESRTLDRQLLDQRIRIARSLHPEQIESLAGRLGPLKPVPMLWCPPAIPLEPESHPELLRDAALPAGITADLRRETELLRGLLSNESWFEEDAL